MQNQCVRLSVCFYLQVLPLFKDRQNWQFWLLFTGLAFVLLLFISPDSYLYGMHHRIDSAWFFMCGKAWMNGLVPYVDFSDSKGPLLWLIYGIGYLFSHTSFHGVFWISCVWYGVTLFITYKTAKFFLPQTKKSVLCTILMTLAFFNPWFHTEIRAEDFAMPFMMLSLYETCCLIWMDCSNKSRRFLVLGGCFSALLLIKFNIAAMQAICILAAMIVLFRQNHLSWRSVLSCFAGAFLLLIPFLIVFLIQGNLNAFIQEYFLRTWETISKAYYGSHLLIRAQESGSMVLLYLSEWTCILDNPKIGTLLLMLLLGGILFAQQQHKHRYLALIVSFLVFAITVRHHILYYFQICSPFLLFLVIGLLQHSNPISRGLLAGLSLITICICITAHVFCHNYKILASRNTSEKEGYQQLAEIITRRDHPTIVNAFDNETGIGTLGEALPAGKYWAYQAGSTQQMVLEHKALILSGKADFVYVRRPDVTAQRGLTISEIEQAGYQIVCIGGEFDNSVLLAKSRVMPDI